MLKVDYRVEADWRGNKVMVIEKAGVLGDGKPGADKQVLEEFFGNTNPKSVTVDGKTVLSRFNPVKVPSRFNPACKE